MNGTVFNSGIQVRNQPVANNLHIPSCAENIFKKCQSIINRMKSSAENSEEFHKNRSELYHYLNRLQQPSPPEAFKNDRCLTNAEGVEKLLLFTGYPGSQNRLMPLALNYLENFHSLERCFQKEVPYDANSFFQTVKLLALSHTAFTNSYCAEAKEVYKTLPELLKITHSEDIDFFIKSYLNSLGKPTVEELNCSIDIIAESDTELVFLFYILTLECALRTDYSPLLFRPFEKQFEELKIEYIKLNKEEREEIFNQLVKKERGLSCNAKKVHEMITTSAYQWQRDPKESKLYASLLSIIFPEVAKSLCLARQIKLVLKDCSHVLPQNIYRVIFYAGLHLNEESDDLFDFYKEKEVLIFKREFENFSQEDKNSIRSAVITGKTTGLKPGLKDEFMIDLAYFSNKLESGQKSKLFVQIFNLVS